MPRYVIYGAGGIGCTIGARLQQAGEDVAYIQRPGKHLETLQTKGMTFICPESPPPGINIPVKAFFGQESRPHGWQ